MKNNAKDLAIELENVILKINDQYNETVKEESRIDSIRDDIFHHIENNTFNASQGYKYTKALQLIAKERRVIKQERATLQCLQNSLSPMQNKILDISKKAINIYEIKNKQIERGSEGYSPRVIKSIDKNDILNQVLQILNSED